MSGLSRLIRRMARWRAMIGSVNKFYGELSMEQLRADVDQATSTTPPPEQATALQETTEETSRQPDS